MLQHRINTDLICSAWELGKSEYANETNVVFMIRISFVWIKSSVSLKKEKTHLKRIRVLVAAFAEIMASSYHAPVPTPRAPTDWLWPFIGIRSMSSSSWSIAPTSRSIPHNTTFQRRYSSPLVSVHRTTYRTRNQCSAACRASAVPSRTLRYPTGAKNRRLCASAWC